MILQTYNFESIFMLKFTLLIYSVIYFFLMLQNTHLRPQNPKLTFSQRLSQFQKQHSYTAYLYAIVSNISLVIMQINLKVVSRYISPLHALAVRGFFLLLINSVVIYYSNFQINIKEPTIFSLLLKRIFFSALTVSMFLAPLKYIPAGTANALFNVAPIIVCFVEAVRYKKPLNFKHFVLTVISFVGILFVIQPDFLFGESKTSYQQHKYLLFFSLAAAFTNSISMSYLHDLKGKVNSTIALHYFYIGQCIFNSVAVMFQGPNLSEVTLDLKFYICVVGLIVFAYFTQNFMTRAIMLKKPSYIMPFGYITIILSSAVDNVIFGNQFGRLSIIGMFLTSSGLLVKLLVPQDDKTSNIKLLTQSKYQLSTPK